jgi:hypothetical protein
MASFNAKAEFVFRAGNTLEVAGVEVGTVEADASGAISSYMTKTSFHQFLDLLPEEATRNAFGKDSTESCLRNLCCDSFSDSFQPERAEYAKFKEVEQSFRQWKSRKGKETESASGGLLSGKPHSIKDQSRDGRLFLQSVGTHAVGRSLVTTSTGHIGLVPDDTRVGDRVCILLGCNSSFILRALSDDSWLVVGACYIHSLANGEALIGPFSSQNDWVRRLAPDGAYFPVFRDQQTGEMTPHHPRAGPLPPEWALRDHDMHEFYEGYVNIETWEQSYFDPRLTSEALRERGVPMRTFKLV